MRRTQIALFSIHLWIFYVAGYAVAFPLQLWANRKRGEPFEDPELLAQKKVYLPAILWIVGGLVISFFVPVTIGFTFLFGLIFALVGLTIVGFTFYSFAHSPGLTTTKIHRISRNPNYIGWDFFMGGLALMGLSNSFWSVLFIIYFFITVVYLHWTVLIEEEFLARKYGEIYQEYLKNIPRYFGKPQKKENEESS